MPGYATPEYRHLLEAERAISTELGNPCTEQKDIAALARALVAVIDQKRVMRGIGLPKPVDSEPTKRKSSRSSATPLDGPDSPK